jgi:hypothetical protein
VKPIIKNQLLHLWRLECCIRIGSTQQGKSKMSLCRGSKGIILCLQLEGNNYSKIFQIKKYKAIFRIKQELHELS